MRMRDAERRARRFIASQYPDYAHWGFDICEEELGRTSRGAKTWSFGLTPDEEDPDHEPGRGFVGYVHADGAVEGLY